MEEPHHRGTVFEFILEIEVEGIAHIGKYPSRPYPSSTQSFVNETRLRLEDQSVPESPDPEAQVCLLSEVEGAEEIVKPADSQHRNPPERHVASGQMLDLKSLSCLRIPVADDEAVFDCPCSVARHLSLQTFNLHSASNPRNRIIVVVLKEILQPSALDHHIIVNEN